MRPIRRKNLIYCTHKASRYKTRYIYYYKNAQIPYNEAKKAAKMKFEIIARKDKNMKHIYNTTGCRVFAATARMLLYSLKNLALQATVRDQTLKR